MRTCSRCKEEKAESDFPKSGGKGGLSVWCRSCHAENYVERKLRQGLTGASRIDACADLLRQVKLKLKEDGITQTKLANEIGVNPSVITLWFRGKTLPSVKNLKLACDFLQVEFPLAMLPNNEGRLPHGVSSCAVCGRDFPVYKAGVVHCSKICSGKALAIRQTGEGNPAWGGGRYKTGGGYVALSLPEGTVLEHRFVMSQKLGRPLGKHERVHHKNGVRSDNRPENLELWTVQHKDPAGVRLADHAAHVVASLPPDEQLAVVSALTKRALSEFLKQPEIVGLESQAEAAFRRVFHIEVT